MSQVSRDTLQYFYLLKVPLIRSC